MPSAYTIHYAIPLCFARTMVRNGQHGVHFTCFRPLRYCAPTNEWQCGACGGLIAGENVVVSGQYRLQAGTRVEAKTGTASTDGANPGPHRIGGSHR